MQICVLTLTIIWIFFNIYSIQIHLYKYKLIKKNNSITESVIQCPK